MGQRADLLQNLGVLVSEDTARTGAQWPLSLEQLGQTFGLVLYSTRLHYMHCAALVGAGGDRSGSRLLLGPQQQGE
jgi:hypothetical protein